MLRVVCGFADRLSKLNSRRYVTPLCYSNLHSRAKHVIIIFLPGSLGYISISTGSIGSIRQEAFTSIVHLACVPVQEH
jgi:hypothetical protein